MALENVREEVTLRGASVIEEETVAIFSSRINEDGIAGAIMVSITNHDLYQEHRTEFRRDQQEFQTRVWEVEDRISEQVESD